MTDQRRWFGTLERVIELLNTLDRAESRFPEIARCLEETFPCRGCRILIRSPGKGGSALPGVGPFRAPSTGGVLPVDGELGKYFRENQGPLFVADQSELPFTPSEGERALLPLAPMTLFPIAGNGLFYGVLCLRNLDKTPLGHDETRTLSTVCKILAGFLRTADSARRVREWEMPFEDRSGLQEGDRETSRLSFLNEALTALLATGEVDEIFHNLLTAVTLGQGLGFN
ncbi:MAG: hypothetical protein JRH07_13510, partial [Deltaproteobacteria bacterium]|nr:hypothetical protein [Deltaproteobacteria bacterium]